MKPNKRAKYKIKSMTGVQSWMTSGSGSGFFDRGRWSGSTSRCRSNAGACRKPWSKSGR